MLNSKLTTTILLASLLLLGSCGIKNEPVVIGTHVSDEVYTEKNPIITEEEKSRTPEDTDINLVKVNKIKSYLRTFCSSYNDINVFTESRHFNILKERVDLVDNTTGNFIYIELPSYVYETCIDKSPEYLETLILYLQTNSDDLVGLKTKIDNSNIENYIGKLSLLDNDNIPKDIKEKNSFNSFFLNEQKEELEAFYYPYYVKEKENISSFLTKPIFSLEKDNSNKEIALRKLIKDLDELGFKTLDEFKTAMLVNNNYLTVEKLKESIINDYKDITSMNEDLSKILVDLGQFKSYIITGKYEELLNNSEINTKISELGKKMLILSIVSNDYADGLNETWAGKQFFGDEEIGNGIIRLNFIYILTL